MAGRAVRSVLPGGEKNQHHGQRHGPFQDPGQRLAGGAEWDEAANRPFISAINNVTMHVNTAHWWPRIPAEYSLQIAPICCYLPTHVHRGEMRQEGIRTRYYLGFPQTGMKEGFVIARPLVGVASLHVRHTR